ncbi:MULTISPECIES: erythromycin resistance leader peptide [Bifidobacterium]|uniref:Erythromycin resistance leader peptide n=2 Tax=Bifidobacterium TaxID=1678 RepID=A0A374Q3F1_BIFAD|nr:erythromycin resistance leader peptide [Bifidobacterium adolescentis]QTL68750.1 erythromycin resistance leader peptide [Bifidobacterium longum]RGJ14309.1 erythromycin resistance leader peptide [Bifidobacterium pseudocatenulatum]TLL61800.1 erythromycin resistance leader peptide [Acinetobacter baumannii]QTL75892.1 erythromycin resistance leader peptide [Bifidobacterium longum]
METSHQPNGRRLPGPLRQIPINQTPHKQLDPLGYIGYNSPMLISGTAFLRLRTNR